MIETVQARQRWLESAKDDPIPDNFSTKRQGPRFRWPARLEIHVSKSADGEGRAEVCYVTGRDISEAGVGFKCRRELHPQTHVEVVLDGEDVKVSAVVRHCTQTIGGFLVGADFEAS